MSIKPGFRSAALLLGPALVPGVALVAHAEMYMSPEQAAQLIFPGQTLERKSIELTADEAAEIARASGETVRAKKLEYFKTAGGDVAFIDQVVGKHEFITMAAGVDAEKGALRGIEIVDYRESYGHQIRREAWRKQFEGKTVKSPLKLDDDVKNISGATLSSAHVTGGARRLLRTYDVLKKRL